MTFKHGKDASFQWNAVDLSTFINNTNFSPSADSHDVSAYGDDGHVYEGGLTDGTLDVSGTYDDGAEGPRATLRGAEGTKATFIWQPEGTGSGLAQDTGDALLLGYIETAPVAGMISWTARFQLSGDIDSTDQV